MSKSLLSSVDAQPASTTVASPFGITGSGVPRRNEGYLKAHLGYHIQGSQVGPYTVVSHEALGVGVFSVVPWTGMDGDGMG